MSVISHFKGELNPNSKLSEIHVREIKEKLKLGQKGSHLAKEYKVTKQTISNIKHGKVWTHV